MRIAIFLFALVNLSIPARADFVIDTFLVGPQSVVANSSNGNVDNEATNLDPSQVLGGRRKLTIQGAMSAGFIRAVVDTGPGSLTYESFNPAYTNSFDGRLLVTHLSGQRNATSDISAYANDTYIVEFERTFWGGSGPQDAILSLSSPSGIANTQLTIPESSTPFSIAVPMSALAAADFSEAYNLKLDIGGISSTASFQINQIHFLSSVPEPSSLFLMAPIAFGLLCRRNRAVEKSTP